MDKYPHPENLYKREYLDGLVEPNFNNYISLISGTVTTLDDVRLRLGPSTDYEKIGGLEAGVQVEVIGVTNNNWFIVKTNNKKIGLIYILIHPYHMMFLNCFLQL